MNAETTPNFLSIEFHVRFFPALLRSRLRSRERTGFGFSTVVELQIVFVFCLVLFVIGIPSAISGKSVLGWVAGGAGGAGMLALLVHSVFSREEPPCYADFLIGVFFFFVCLGLTAGVFVGTLEHSLPLGLLIGSVGLVAGYLFGILAGLWFQYIGWLSILGNGLAALAVLGMVLVDILLISGILFR